MRRVLIKMLLGALNSRWLNVTPCQYGHINNIEAFSYQNCVDEDKQQPGITVREMLDYADRFKSCSLNKNGLMVIEPDGSTHEATVWDRHELSLALMPYEATRLETQEQSSEG